MAKTKTVKWKPDYYLYSVLQPKRADLIRDIEDSEEQNRERRSNDHHGVQTRAAYYCEVALKCLISVLGTEPRWTHDLNVLYKRAAQLYPGDLDREIQTRIERLAESSPVLTGFHFAEPSGVTKAARNYYKRSRYPKALAPGQWSKPQLVPHHLFAVGDGAAALAEELLRSSSRAV